jgi:heat-inducible transcriptional repressor
MPELLYRSRRILYAAVTEYITTGEPVGSRKLAKRYGLTVSPATIRNELADLEDQGFLVQPHTSAGRVPTDKGFRTFVDALVQMREVEPEGKAALLTRLTRLRPGVDDLPREASRLLSSLTGAASLVHTPPSTEQPIAQLRWLPLREGQLLAVLVTRGGSVENRVVSLERTPEARELESLHNYLGSLLGERSLSELREIVARAAAHERSEFTERARQMLEATAAAGSPQTRAVVIEGQTRLLGQPDFASVDKMRGVLNVLEERERLLELLDRTLVAGGVQVLIGAETKLAEAQDLSLITATYGKEGGNTGTLGVIAPTRTDYQKVVPLVGFAADLLTDLLEKKH